MCTKLIQELSATAERISPTHHRNLFRPPFGLRWFGLADILKQHNLQAVMWDVNGEDWKRPPQEISRKVVKEARAGSIILLHDGMPPNESGNRANTAQALPEIIRELSREYKLVTIPELMGWPEKQARGQ